MKSSICTRIMSLLTMVVLVTGQHSPAPSGQHSQQEIDNAWIRVPWTNGGYYFHNTLTREDRDSLPERSQYCNE